MTRVPPKTFPPVVTSGGMSLTRAEIAEAVNSWEPSDGFSGLQVKLDLHYRMADRVLQYMRKANLIRYSGGKWEWVE